LRRLDKRLCEPETCSTLGRKLTGSTAGNGKALLDFGEARLKDFAASTIEINLVLPDKSSTTPSVAASASHGREPPVLGDSSLLKANRDGNGRFWRRGQHAA
jgi:hypothetical protein